MAPSRKASKKRKREKHTETEGVAEASMDDSDWWHELSQRLSTTGSMVALNLKHSVLFDSLWNIVGLCT